MNGIKGICHVFLTQSIYVSELYLVVSRELVEHHEDIIWKILDLVWPNIWVGVHNNKSCQCVFEISCPIVIDNRCDQNSMN